jgi:hypothetical protein
MITLLTPYWPYDPETLNKITGGNPLFITESLANSDYNHHVIPASIREAVLIKDRY